MASNNSTSLITIFTKDHSGGLLKAIGFTLHGLVLLDSRRVENGLFIGAPLYNAIACNCHSFFSGFRHNDVDPSHKLESFSLTTYEHSDMVILTELPSHKNVYGHSIGLYPSNNLYLDIAPNRSGAVYGFTRSKLKTFSAANNNILGRAVAQASSNLPTESVDLLSALTSLAARIS